MKVVLLKDVKNTGRAGAVVNCSDGHAQNFLIPRGMAALATPANLKQAELRTKQDIDKKQLDVKLIEDRIAALSEGTTQIIKKANEKGHLYDAVDAADIAKATELPEDAIKLEKPFKEVGTFDVPVSLGERFGKISITITAE
ncbi:MAG: 50S ribosomal protein L9 [Patescibacteria group bacterium]